MEPIDEKDLDLESKFKGGTGHPTEAGPKMEAEKEVLPEKLSVEKDSTYNNILSKVKTTQAYSPTEDEVKADALAAYNKMGAEGQVQHLVDLALNKGVSHAVKVARHLESNYVLDMLHDRLLAEEFHDALVKKGLLKEI